MHQQSKGRNRPEAAAATDPLDRTERASNANVCEEHTIPLKLEIQNDNDVKDDDGVPRVISYSQLASLINPSRLASDLSVSGDVGGEDEALLDTNKSTSINHQSYGGTTNGESNLKSPRSLSGSYRPRRKAGRKTQTPLQSSFLSVRSASLRSPRFDSVILAPDNVTPLIGSSKLAANALCAELRKSERRISCQVENGDDGSTIASVRTARTLQEVEEEYLQKTRTTFYNDAVTFAEGTIPQSIVMAFSIGCVCGVVAYLYYTILEYLLELFWKTGPERFVIDKWPEHLHVLWIPLVAFTMSICCGLSIYYLGEPGDLAYTIKCVHEKGFKGTQHIPPMVASSLFSILAGASLGPEAPLVAICAAMAGFVSRKVFKQTNRNVIRKHTFMGMAGALSAFFGVPLGGSIFALEITSRFGIEYFEHLIEAVFAGEICIVVFRSLAGLPLSQIWADAGTPYVGQADPYMIILGACIGLLGAGMAALWANFHWRLMGFFQYLRLLDDENTYALPRVLVGALGVVIIGMLVPQTMFWGEWEFPVLATLSPTSELPHVWPPAGLIGFEMDSCLNCVIVGFCKLLAISFTVAGGFRGGYIFPFFTAGAAFGRALCFAFPTLSPVLATLCFAAGINVAITRTALATSLILAFLSGEQLALPSILAASIASLFATGYMPFIKSQIARSDIDFSLYIRKDPRTGKF